MGSVFICGLATAIGHITSYVSRKSCQCSLRPHHAVSPPHCKTSLSGPFPVRLSHNFKEHVQSANLPTPYGDPFAIVWFYLFQNPLRPSQAGEKA